MIRRIAIALIAAAALIPAASAQDKPQDEKKLTFNFKDAPMDQVLLYVSTETGWKFVFDKDAKAVGTITAISDGPVGLDKVLVILDTALRQHGLATLNLFSPRLPRPGETVTIVKTEEALKRNLEVHYGADPEKIQITPKVITQIIPLKGANVVDIKKELETVLQKCVEPDGSFSINTYSNSLIFVGRSDGINRAARILNVIDVKAAEELKTKVFALKNADASETTKVLNEVFKKETQAANRDANPFGRMMEFFGGGGRGRQDQGPTPKTVASEIVRIVAETRTNSIICVATVDNMKTIEELITQLDSKSAELIKLKYYPLRYADAKEVATLIAEIFAEEGQSSSTGRSGQSQRGRNPFQPFMFGQQGQQDPATAASREVRAVADVRTNSVVVAASEKNFVIIDEMVSSLDRQVSDTVQVKIYKMKNADAKEMAAILREMFRPQVNASQQSGRQTGGQQGGGQQNPFMQMFNRGTGQGSSSGSTLPPNQEVEISADTRTNSVVVKASPDYLVIMDAIVEQLDKDATESVSTYVIPLRNANATDMATVLRDLLRGGTSGASRTNQQGSGLPFNMNQQNQQGGSTRGNQGGNQGTRQGGGNQTRGGNLGPLEQDEQIPSSQDEEDRQRGIQGQVDVQADSATNTLVIRTSPRNFQAIQNIVQDLDRMRPQVLIKVLIADVTLDDSTQFGVEGFWENKMTVRGGDKATNRFGTDFNTPTQGFSYLLSGDEFEASIKAFAKDGKLKILATPRILVLDNQTANINIGKEVPVITNSQINQQGNTINTVRYETIGILLEVTPHINPDGLVTMVVHPEVSDIASQAESVKITEGANSPTFIVNSADTTVAVRNGMTVVIGGLIRETVDDSTEKIPILGDIPIIGLLFSNTTKKKNKREIMIFLTPYVAYTAAELEEITELEKSRLKLIDQKDIESETDRWLDRVRH